MDSSVATANKFLKFLEKIDETSGYLLFF